MTITVVFLILSSFKTVSAPTNIFFKENSLETRQGKIIVDLMNSFASGQFIHIVTPEEKSTSWFWNDLKKEILFDKWSVVITKPPKQTNDNIIVIYVPDVYVIFFNNNQHLVQFHNIIDDLVNQSSSWNPGAIFLLVATVNNEGSQDINEFATDIFNYLWKRNAFRVSLVIFNKNSKDITHLSSLPYFKAYNTCKEITSFSQLQQINLVKEILSGSILAYRFKTPNSFLGCPLVGHTYPFPPYSVPDTDSATGKKVYRSGIEVELVRLLANLYNFSLEITSTLVYGTASAWSHQLPNGSYRGMLEDVSQGNIDLAFAGGIPRSTHYFRISLANAYIYNSLSWYVPDPDIMPNWKLILNTFSGFTWLILALSCLFVSLLYFLMIGRNRSNAEGPVDLVMVALSVGFTIRWSKKCHIRFILLAWSLFSFHATLMFTTRLFSVLTHRPLDSGISTIKELHDSKLQVVISSAFRIFYLNQTDGLIRKLIETAKIRENINERIKGLLEHNSSIVTKDDYIAFAIDEERAQVHKLKEKFITYPVMMSVAKGSVFLEYMNRLIFNVTESGIILKWLGDTLREEKTKSNPRETNDSDNENILLKNEDLIWLYKLFWYGQGIALVVFVIEIYFKKQYFS